MAGDRVRTDPAPRFGRHAHGLVWACVLVSTSITTTGCGALTEYEKYYSTRRLLIAVEAGSDTGDPTLFEEILTRISRAAADLRVRLADLRVGW